MSMRETVENATASFLNKLLGDDIYDQLKGEHRELQDLLSRAESAEPHERKDLLNKIEAMLVPHARAEEKTIYALMRQRIQERRKDDEEALNLTNEAYEEHRAVDKLMADLKAADIESETWIPKLKVIKENLEHHIDEEEHELFRVANDLFTTDESQELLEAYLDQKERFISTLPSQAQIAAKRPSSEAAKLS